LGLLFLSHAGADAELAGFLDGQIRRLVPECEVFRTSRTGQIIPGDEWFRVITENLRQAASYLILVTPNSVTRPWMWFEAGAGWMSARPVIPVTIAISKADVPEPLRFFQIYSLESAAEAATVFARLGGALPDPEMFAAAVVRLAIISRERAETEEGWEGVRFNQYFIAWDGPLDSYGEAADIPAPDKLIDLLNEQGRHQAFAPRNSLASHLYKGYRQLWAVDLKRKRRHALIEQGGQVLMSREGPKPGGG
jgi:hypothetical protein